MIFSWGVAMESEEKRAEWEARVKAWKASGLTQKEYCLREGIGFSGMRYWSARSGSAKLNRSDKCIIGVLCCGKKAVEGDQYEQIIRATDTSRIQR